LSVGREADEAGPKQDRLFDAPALFCPFSVRTAPKKGQTTDLEGAGLALDQRP